MASPGRGLSAGEGGGGIGRGRGGGGIAGAGVVAVTGEGLHCGFSRAWSVNGRGGRWDRARGRGRACLLGSDRDALFFCCFTRWDEQLSRAREQSGGIADSQRHTRQGTHLVTAPVDAQMARHAQRGVRDLVKSDWVPL